MAVKAMKRTRVSQDRPSRKRKARPDKAHWQRLLLNRMWHSIYLARVRVSRMKEVRYVVRPVGHAFSLQYRTR